CNGRIAMKPRNQWPSRCLQLWRSRSPAPPAPPGDMAAATHPLRTPQAMAPITLAWGIGRAWDSAIADSLAPTGTSLITPTTGTGTGTATTGMRSLRIPMRPTGANNGRRCTRITMALTRDRPGKTRPARRACGSSRKSKEARARSILKFDEVEGQEASGCDGSFAVVFPAFPEIVTFGRTLDASRAMARDALRCHLEGLRKDGHDEAVHGL